MKTLMQNILSRMTIAAAAKAASIGESFYVERDSSTGIDETNNCQVTAITTRTNATGEKIKQLQTKTSARLTQVSTMTAVDL